MSCLSALHTQIATLLSMPHEVLLLRHRVFREYAKTALGPDFIHTLPSFLILTAAILVLWRNPPSFARLLDIVGATPVYKGLQVSVSWLAINALLWLWLILQRILYCSVWHYWSYESEYRGISYPWWQRVWSSYFPAVQPPLMSAGFISWIIAMLIAIAALGCAISTNHVQTFVKESLCEAQVALAMAKSYMMWPWERMGRAIVSSVENVVMDDSEISSCDDARSEMSIEANVDAALGDVHPISYGTNWMPQPNFSMFKEAQRKISMKSFNTVAGDIQDHDKFAAKLLRHRRGCHTVIPSKQDSSEQSSGC